MKALTRLLALLFLLAYPLHAATHYVAKTGADSGTCTVGSPCLTINYAMTKIAAADTLEISAGTYAESVGHFGSGGDPPSGTGDGTRTTIKAKTGDTVTVQAVNIYSRSYITISHIICSGSVSRAGRNATTDAAATYITFDTCEFKSVPGGGSGMGALMIGFRQESVANSHMVISNCSAHDNGANSLDHGLYISTGDAIVDGGTYYNNYSYGVHVYVGSTTGYTTSNTIIRNVKSYNNGGYGIGAYRGNNLRVYNNLVYGNGTHVSGAGIATTYGATNGYMANNTVYNNTGYGIWVGSSSGSTATGTTVRNNIIYSNSLTNLQDEGTSTVKTNNLTTNPSFTNAGSSDFTLTAGSTAIDAGYDMSAIYTTDLLGTTRANGSTTGTAFDEGAYEYQSPPGTITVLVPNGGESWQIGQTKTITWSSVGAGATVDITADLDGNGSYETSIVSATTNDGSYDWVVAGSANVNCKVKVKDSAAATNDVSDAVFALTASSPGTITVSLPVSGYVHPQSGIAIIRWTSANVTGNVKIELSRDGGTVWETITSSTAFDSSDYTWVVTGQSSSNCVFKITSLNDTSVSGTSPTFRIGGTYFILQ